MTVSVQNGSFEGAETAAEGQAYTGRIAAAEGWKLPESITVNIGGQELSQEAYAYDPVSGILTIPGAQITGDLEITAICVEEAAEDPSDEKPEDPDDGKPEQPEDPDDSQQDQGDGQDHDQNQGGSQTGGAQSGQQNPGSSQNSGSSAETGDLAAPEIWTAAMLLAAAAAAAALILKRKAVRK